MLWLLIFCPLYTLQMFFLCCGLSFRFLSLWATQKVKIFNFIDCIEFSCILPFFFFFF